MIPDPVRDWLWENGYGRVVSERPVGGGCINNGARLTTGSGKPFFLKTNPHAPADMFEREAEGLQALGVEGGPRIPAPHLWGSDFLLTEDLAPAPTLPGYWPEFGRRLAALHDHTGAVFGFSHDNYLGRTPQPNPPTGDGHAFFGEHRLLFQARRALSGGLLTGQDAARVERLAARLPDLVPAQPPSLIHGDLWKGNALTGPLGEPALIDPAAHYGWAEAELAMTALFGGFPEAFYRAYEEARPLAPGWRDRFPIYNLYHLLNHLNLFGSGYLGEVLAILHLFS